LRAALRKLGFREGTDLLEILDFCSADLLAGQPMRRGLFIQETARFYRPLGGETWKSTTPNGLARLADPVRHPIIATKEYQTHLFEHMEVAFRPRICIRAGVTVLQAYLILLHELVHLVGLDPFDRLDLFSFTPANKEDFYYRKQLTERGGELEAYMAQLRAFRHLRKRYDLSIRSTLEDFLTEGGHLLGADRDAFLDHLLERANYRDVLERELIEQVVFQYNLAHSWWEAIGEVIAQLDEHAGELEAVIETLRVDARIAAESGRYRQAELIRNRRRARERQLNENRTRREAYAVEQAAHIRFMERVDARFPRNR